MKPASTRSTRHDWRYLISGLTCAASLVSLNTGCGSRNDEDIDKAASKPNQQNSSPVTLTVPSATSSDSVVEGGPCSFVLKQTLRFVVDKDKGNVAEATFSGKADTSCADADKKPILYIKFGNAQFTPPVELDCQLGQNGQPLADGYNMRCVTANSIVSANGEVRLVVKADAASYLSSQTSMKLAYEVP
jgi:hypothetical protein